MKAYLLAFLLLVACSPPEPITPTVQVVLSNCDATQSIGERCSKTCECLRPGKCINSICSLTGLGDEQPCVANQQCLSGSCIQNHCTRATPERFDCERVCRTDYGVEEECKTVCRR